jgi:hypothetical protein
MINKLRSSLKDIRDLLNDILTSQFQCPTKKNDETVHISLTRPRKFFGTVAALYKQ